MESSDLLGFLVGLFGGLLGCLLVFLMQRPGAPKQQEMGASEASEEAKSSKDRTQAVLAESEGPAVASPPNDSKAPSDDDQKDAGPLAGTADCRQDETGSGLAEKPEEPGDALTEDGGH